MPRPSSAVADLDRTANDPVSVGRFERSAASATRRAPVTHAYATLGFTTRGGSRVEQRGEWTVREGDVLLVPAGEPHRLLDSRGHSFWGLSFCVPCYADPQNESLLSPFERVRDGGSAVVSIPSSRHAYLDGLFEELDRVGRESVGVSRSRDAVQTSLLTLILAEVERASSPVDASPASRPGVVTDALRHIERNCLGPLTVEQVAAAVGRTPTYVTTALTNATGRSAVQWIVSSRMAVARRLLLHSEDGVEQVAGRVGYADPTHFIRMFRREHGLTPAAWRAERRRAPDTSVISGSARAPR